MFECLGSGTLVLSDGWPTLGAPERPLSECSAAAKEDTRDGGHGSWKVAERIGKLKEGRCCDDDDDDALKSSNVRGSSWKVPVGLGRSSVSVRSV